jgi:hypothetical protein
MKSRGNDKEVSNFVFSLELTSFRKDKEGGLANNPGADGTFIEDNQGRGGGGSARR